MGLITVWSRHKSQDKEESITDFCCNYRAEMKHKLNPVLDAQLNRNRSRRLGHRRNLSDGGHVAEDVSENRRKD